MSVKRRQSAKCHLTLGVVAVILRHFESGFWILSMKHANSCRSPGLRRQSGLELIPSPWVGQVLGYKEIPFLQWEASQQCLCLDKSSGERLNWAASQLTPQKTGPYRACCTSRGHLRPTGNRSHGHRARGQSASTFPS